MKRTTSVALAFLITTDLASATLITFDDLAAPAVGGTTVPNGYQGLNWVNFFYMNQNDPSLTPSGYQNGTVSSPNVGGMSNDALQSEINGALFDFNSIYLTSAWETGLDIRVRGYLLGATLYDTTVEVNTTGPTLFNFNYLGVDKVTFDTTAGSVGPFGDHGKFFALDNVTVIQPGTVQSVPESGSSALMLGAAILGIAILRMKSLLSKLTL